MNEEQARHVDEDLLASWVLDGEALTGEADRAHLERCPLCRRREDALRRLAATIAPLGRARSEMDASGVPPRLSCGMLARRGRRLDAAWAAAGLAAVAALAAIVPRSVPRDEYGRIASSHEAAMAIEILAAASSEVVDSLLAVSPASMGVAMPGEKSIEWTETPAELGSDARRRLYLILQQKLERGRTAGSAGLTEG